MHFCKLWIRSNWFVIHVSYQQSHNTSYHVQVTCRPICIFVIQLAAVFVATEPGKPKHDLFLSLAKCFLCLNLNQTIGFGHNIKLKIEHSDMWSCNIRRYKLLTYLRFFANIHSGSGVGYVACHSILHFHTQFCTYYIERSYCFQMYFFPVLFPICFFYWHPQVLLLPYDATIFH